ARVDDVSRYGDPRYLHSFPTRRSSDLTWVRCFSQRYATIRGRSQLPGSTIEGGYHIGRRAARRHRNVFRAGRGPTDPDDELGVRSEEHTSELQSRENLVRRLLHDKKKA